MNNNTYVSIIIPVFNDIERLKLCLDALERQSYPKNAFEIIIVDNNSTENIENLVKSYSNTIYAYENKKGSYAARNKGISIAKGEILAFTDSDCIPSDNWIENGIRPIIEGKTDLVGGEVEFYFRNNNSPAELYDSINFLNPQKSNKPNSCVTANLFVKKILFNEVGLFQEVISGGDWQWSMSAAKKNYTMYYSNDAVVKHPTRTFNVLLKKFYRVGTGIISRDNMLGFTKSKMALHIMKETLPPRFITLKQRIKNHNIEVSKILFMKMWFVSIICTCFKDLGILTSLLKTLFLKIQSRLK